MIKTHKPDTLFLVEPLIHFTSIPSWYWKRLNLQLSKNGQGLSWHSTQWWPSAPPFLLNFFSRDRLGIPFTRLHMS